LFISKAAFADNNHLKNPFVFVGNIYKKEKEKKSLCCTSPLIRGDELSLRSIQILLFFVSNF